MRLLLAVTALLVAAAPAAANPEGATESQVASQAEAQPEAAAERQVCRTVPDSVSRLGRRVCRTPAQWREHARRERSSD